MAKDYIEKRDAGYYSLVAGFRFHRLWFPRWLSAEGILEFVSNTYLEQIHGSLAFYLANRKEIDD